MAKLVSKVYGDALFQAAVQAQKVDAFLTDVKYVQNLLEAFGASPDCKRRKETSVRENF